MSKIITSPAKKWPGTVTIADPLTYPQVIDVEDTINRVLALDDNEAHSHAAVIWLPTIFKIVETWQLDGMPENLTPENFPATPRAESARLIAWLIGEITRLFNEANEVPNE